MSLDGRKRKGKKMTPEQEAAFGAALAEMPEEQRRLLEEAAWVALMKAHKVTDVDGKKVRAGRVPGCTVP